MCKASSKTKTEGFQAQIQPRLNMEFQTDMDCVDTPCPKGIPSQEAQWIYVAWGQACLLSNSRALGLHSETTLFLKNKARGTRAQCCAQSQVLLTWMPLKHHVCPWRKTTVSTHAQDQQYFPGSAFHFLSLFIDFEGRYYHCDSIVKMFTEVLPTEKDQWQG